MLFQRQKLNKSVKSKFFKLTFEVEITTQIVKSEHEHKTTTQAKSNQ